MIYCVRSVVNNPNLPFTNCVICDWFYTMAEAEEEFKKRYHDEHTIYSVVLRVESLSQITKYSFKSTYDFYKSYGISPYLLKW